MDIRLRFVLWAMLMAACVGLLMLSESIANKHGAASAFPVFGAGAISGVLAIILGARK